MTPETIRVVLADDHAALRAGVAAALDGTEFEVVAEVDDAAGALAAARAHRPHLCLLDVEMPGNGIAACRAIRQELAEVVVVMLTVSTDDDDLFDALLAGAAGYLLKTTSPGRLEEALRGALAGEAALPRTLMTRVLGEFRNRRRRRLSLGPRSDALTEREWDVLELLAEGLATREIADRLFLSAITVRTHTSSILRKLAVPDRQSLIDLARRGHDR